MSLKHIVGSNKDKKVLIVDDDQDLQAFVSITLKASGYEVKSAYSGEEALGLIHRWHPDLVILDMNMPGINGLETLKVLKEQKQYVAVIFLTADSSTEQVIQGLDAGADDYMPKPFSPSELMARVRAQLRIKDLTDRLSVANKKLQALVDIDDLTGLYNMRNLYEKLEFEMKRARRYKRQVGVVMMDMDKFKSVNDSNDHLFGSFVLKHVGAIIKSNVRDTDIAARYGGDEFIMILTETNIEGATIFSERLRESIEAFNFDNGEFAMRLTCSIGLALSDPHDMDLSGRQLVKWADKALYESKRSGRNRVTIYNLEELAQQKIRKGA